MRIKRRESRGGERGKGKEERETRRKQNCLSALCTPGAILRISHYYLVCSLKPSCRAAMTHVCPISVLCHTLCCRRGDVMMNTSFTSA